MKQCMLDELKKILTDGVQQATEQQAEHLNNSYVMQGKSAAFREVLYVIGALELKGKEDERKNTEDK